MRKSILDLQSRDLTPPGWDLLDVPAGRLQTCPHVALSLGFDHRTCQVREGHRTMGIRRPTPLKASSTLSSGVQGKPCPGLLLPQL